MRVAQDLTGQRFGRLTVIERAPQKIDSAGCAIWRCKCDCGREKIVRSGDLKNRTLSCGCLHKEINSRVHLKDMTGQKFGKLTVIQRVPTENTRDRCARWLCRCDCGNEIIVRGACLRAGHTTSCGCVTSLGEEATIKALLNKTIGFSTQYRFDDLKSKKGHNLMFDFALQGKNKEVLCLIEYQGSQHYVDFGEFGKQQREETDQLKRDYCKAHNIPLYEIRYDENVENRIDEILADIHYFDDKPQLAASARLV